MEIKKYHKGDGHLLSHVDRSTREIDATKPYESGILSTPNASDIDPSRSHLNFNLSENNRHLTDVLDYIRETTGRPVRKNAVLFFSTWVVMPKQYQKFDGDLEFAHHFFEDIYDTLLLFYGLEDSDVASAWVHMDETRPHLHLYTSPIYRAEDGTLSNCFERVVPKRKYWKLHSFTEDMMRSKGWEDIELMSGTTREGNWAVRDLKRNGAKEKVRELNELLAKKQAELDQLNQNVNSQTELLRKFMKEEREKENRLRELQESTEILQGEMDRLNRDILRSRTELAKQGTPDAETKILLNHKKELIRSLIEHPENLTAGERMELMNLNNKNQKEGLYDIHQRGIDKRGHIL